MRKPEETAGKTKKWKDNIKMDLKRSEGGGMDWIDLAKDRDQCRDLVNAVINLRLP
jgi:hypothetical protein